MPDLQSELSKLANAWDTHEQTIRHDSHEPLQEKALRINKTGNTSRDLFHFIQAHPYKYTPLEVKQLMTEQGFNPTSVSSLITQMKRNNMLDTSDSGRIATTQPAYNPIINPYTSKRPAKAKKSAPAGAGIAALTPAPEAKTTWDAETALANLSVKDAHALWVELNKMFGGK